MSQIQLGSEEQRFARWVIYAVLAAPIVATLLHDLGVGAVAPWIIYAIIAVPMIAMLFDRKIDVDPLVRWVLFALIALAAILPTRFS
jgi:amino acid permease